MSTPRERLRIEQGLLDNALLNDGPIKKAAAHANIECAIEMTDSLVGLSVAVNDMADRSVTVMNNLITKIDETTKQAAESAKESGKVATESANLSRKVNSLTKWIMTAAILSALAAGIQAGVALYNAFHPQQILVQLVAPTSHATTAPEKK
jgi:hypothetical protein